MQSTAFIHLVADAYGVADKTVAMYARVLKEAGLMTSGARGVNAPHMLPLDAATLTIALLATTSSSRAAERCREFGSMVVNPEFLRAAPLFDCFNGRLFTLDSILERMFASAPDDDLWLLPVDLEVREAERSATLNVTTTLGPVVGHFSKWVLPNHPTEAERREKLGIKTARSIGYVGLLKVWLALCSNHLSRSDPEVGALTIEHKNPSYEHLRRYVVTLDPDWEAYA